MTTCQTLMNRRNRPTETGRHPSILLALLSAVLWSGLLLSAGAAEAPLKVLILSGQNNHDWKSTTPKLESILTNSGRFQVSVTDHPEQLNRSALRGYDVLLSNWNTYGQGGTKEWPAGIREAFLEFVREGHGLVVVHAGGSSFPEWNDYQELIGGTWGPETGHGPPHRFAVKILTPDHPITQGLPLFFTTDELWHRMATRPHKTVLATAFSGPGQGGSGQAEPVAFVTRFGQGQCFNLVLGHDVSAMNSPGFQALLTRGTEWAATGKVSIPVPVAALSGEWEALLDATVAEPTVSRQRCLEMDQIVAGVSTQPALSKVLARLLASRLPSATTPEARMFLLRQLSLVGNEDQVPAVAPLLLETNVSFYARQALVRIAGNAALEALRSALPKTSGLERAGLIDSLANWTDAKVIRDLIEQARGHDPEAARAAIRGLGCRNEPEALVALVRLKADRLPQLEPALTQAQVQCAASAARSGHSEEASPVLEKLFAPSEPPTVRTAAFQAWAASQGRKSTGRVMAALADSDPVIRQAGLLTLRNCEESALRTAAQQLGSLSPEVEVCVLGLLTERRVSGVVAGLLRSLPSQDSSVRLAALDALGVLGDASVVRILTDRVLPSPARERAAIADTLARMPDSTVAAELIKALRAGDREVQLVAIRALRARSGPEALPAFTQAAAAADPEVSRESIRALGQLAGRSACPGLIALLGKASPQIIPEIESALAEICRRETDISPLQTALLGAAPAVKLALLNTLAAAGGPMALAALQAELEAKDPDVRLATLRLLAYWPDPSPLKTLATVAQTSPDSRSRTLALRGVARLAPMAEGLAAIEAVESIGKALPGADPGEQRLLLAALGEMTNSASLKVVASRLQDPVLAAEAMLSAFRILEGLDSSNRAEVTPVLEQLRSSRTSVEQKERLDWFTLKFANLGHNLSLGASATNLDGLTVDGQGGPPAAAIDGDEKTYWDETDNQKLYRLRIDLKQRSRISLLRIVGWQHQNYAPCDFEVYCDDQLQKKVEGAQYLNNSVRVDLRGTVCRSLELRITRAYGPSPAIRELEIYGEAADR